LYDHVTVLMSLPGIRRSGRKKEERSTTNILDTPATSRADLQMFSSKNVQYFEMLSRKLHVQRKHL